MGTDDEFERIVAGLTGDGAPEEVPAQPGPAGLAMVLTPVASAAALAGLCAMSGIACKVLPTSTGAVAAMELSPSDDPFAELDTSAPREADEFAAALSRLTHTEVVLVVARLRDADDGPTGRLAAFRYSQGANAGDTSPGLVLASGDAIVEDLLLGTVRLEDVSGVEDTSEIPRWRAAKMFTRGLRKRKQ